MLLQKIWTSDVLPVAIEDVKLDLRVDSSDGDATIRRMIFGASDFLERRTGWVLTAGTYEATFNDWDHCFPCSGPPEFMRGPLRGVVAVEYLSARETWTPVELTDFQIARRRRSFILAALSGFTAPTTFTGLDSVRVRFDAGFDGESADTGVSGDPIPLEAGLQTILIMLVGHFYKNRELFEADKLAQIEVGAGSMLGAYRQYW